MVLYSSYLFFKNNFIAFTNTQYLYHFFNTLALLTISSTVPYICLEYVSAISNNRFINTLCYYIYFILYFLPSFGILFAIHNFKLTKILSYAFKQYNNPSHIYLNGLTLFMYIVYAILNTLFNKFRLGYIISNTLSYSIFLNEIAYMFLDNDKYGYSNRIDFYNNNVYIFIFYGYISTYFTYSVSNIYFLPVSFLVMSIIQNGLINIDYHKATYTTNINLAYMFEYVFNPISKLLGKTLLFLLYNRNMIVIKY